jgi:hypothetical protein
MRAPMLLDLPQSRRLQDHGDVAAASGDEHTADHSQPRLALYASSHSRSGRPKFVGPAPQPTWGQRLRGRLHRMLGRETTS